MTTTHANSPSSLPLGSLLAKGAARVLQRVGLGEVVDYYQKSMTREPTLAESAHIGAAFLYSLGARAFNELAPGLFYDHFHPKPHFLRRDRDFGNLFDKGPQEVVKVSSIEQLRELFQQAEREQRPIHLCGSTHSSRGVTLSGDGGLRVMLRGIPSHFRMIDDEIAELSAFATVGDAARFVAKHGRMLPVLGDQLGLSVGGYLSAGGVGFNSVEYGFFADHVVRFEFMQPNGEIISCTAESDPELFYAVLGGQGQLGVLLSAQVRTIPRKHTYLRLDIATLERVEQVPPLLERAHAQNWNYFFGDLYLDEGELKLVYYAGRDQRPGVDLASFEREFETTLAHPSMTVRKAHLARWKHNRLLVSCGYTVPTIVTKYWISSSYALSFKAFCELLPEMMPALELSQSSMFLYLMADQPGNGGAHHSFIPSRQRGREQDFMVYCGIFYTGCGLGPREMDERKRVIGELMPKIVAAGGELYLEGYQPRLSRELLEQAYPHYERFRALKARLDPHNLFCPDGIEAGPDTGTPS